MKVQLLDWWGKSYSLRVGGYPQWVGELDIRWTGRSSEYLLFISPSLDEVKDVLVALQEEALLWEEEGIEWVAPSSLHPLLPGEWSYPWRNVWDDPKEEEWEPTPEELLDEQDFHYTSYKENVDGEKEENKWGGFVRTHSPTQGEVPKWKARQEARKERTIKRKEARRVKYR